MLFSTVGDVGTEWIYWHTATHFKLWPDSELPNPSYVTLVFDHKLPFWKTWTVNGGKALVSQQTGVCIRALATATSEKTVILAHYLIRWACECVRAKNQCDDTLSKSLAAPVGSSSRTPGGPWSPVSDCHAPLLARSSTQIRKTRHRHARAHARVHTHASPETALGWSISRSVSILPCAAAAAAPAAGVCACGLGD